MLQQVTLDAILERVEAAGSVPRDELLFEAATVLAGIILMASGTSGGSPQAHDSSTTLATLLPHIAAYRDAFYKQLFSRLSSTFEKEEGRAPHDPAGGKNPIRVEGHARNRSTHAGKAGAPGLVSWGPI